MTEKINSLDRKELIIRMVQDPVAFLKINKSKGCAKAIIFLMNIRKKIKEDGSYAIKKPNPNFKQFYMADNDTTEHYVALFIMLKAAGYDKIEALSASMDVLPDGVHGSNTGRSDAIKKYLALVSIGADTVYEKN